MIKWSVSTEVFSLIILFILILNFRERRWHAFPQRRLYLLCLYLSAVTVIFNILCVYFISVADSIPLSLNVITSSIYFLLILSVSSIIAYYLCHLLYEHIYQQRGIRKYGRLLLLLYAAYALLIVCNLRTGVVFSFDDQLHYQRGPLINAGYGVMLLQLFGLLVIAMRHWRSISASMHKVMRLLPPIIVALTAYQIIYPNVLFNGGLIVAADLILLINFQSRTIEQDSLTTSGNRPSLHQELLLRTGGKQCFQVLALSLKQFRTINQRYGSKRGDALLCRISQWLEHLHPRGKSFRMGNVSFALLVPYEGQQSADRLADTIYARFQNPWHLDGVSVTPQAFFAEFIYTGQEENADEILELINFSLSLAKTQKKHLLRFDPSIYQKMAEQSRIMLLLQRAVRDKRFETWYQPIYHSQTGQFSMAEALLRLRDEQGELVSPSLFIPLAEANGYLEEITDIILDHVCHLLQDPATDRLQSISVNLSAQQLLSDDLIYKLDRLREQYQFDPHRLRLEVTERVISENPQKMQAIMSALSQRGFLFSLDDFGTGHSNLSLVLENAFTCIKLDRSLIQDYPDSERSAFIVNTMLDMFHSLDCDLIVEGVEREEQARALTDHGVQWIQGFYYAKPMPADALKHLLAAS